MLLFAMIPFSVTMPCTVIVIRVQAVMVVLNMCIGYDDKLVSVSLMNRVYCDCLINYSLLLIYFTPILLVVESV
jgi:hypothetical protein